MGTSAQIHSFSNKKSEPLPEEVSLAAWLQPPFLLIIQQPVTQYEPQSNKVGQGSEKEVLPAFGVRQTALENQQRILKLHCTKAGAGSQGSATLDLLSA